MLCRTCPTPRSSVTGYVIHVSQRSLRPRLPVNARGMIESLTLTGV